MIDFSKLGKKENNSSIEPRDIFMSLPTKDKQYEYPRDVQSEVWKGWFENRNKKNTIIKMNTGSGKTVVGLTILKSCIEEGKGPAVYVVPDNYLVQQVCLEAEKLGINVVKDEDEYDFISKKAILVINIHKLVNGKSIFGMRKENNINIGSIIIDDVHACLGTIKTQFTIKIPSEDSAYDELIETLQTGLKSYSDQKFQQIVELKEPRANMLVPFWIWQNNFNLVYALLNKYSEKDYFKFNLPLIVDSLVTCNCVISARCIEITPKCIPIDKIKSFEQAERRIFMSATLADDSIFITAMGLAREDVSNIITPEKANDVGDRLLIFPQVINKGISDLNIKEKLKDLSKKHNTVVIVPSLKRSEFWRDVSDMILDIRNINEGVKKLKKEHVGLVVFINKYDGVDLPNDACRIIVIDGLPHMQNEYDSFLQSTNPNNKLILSEQIQKIEQGIGRGVRSNNDYCVAILIGKELSDVIIRADGYRFFSQATQKQFELSKDLWDQLRSENRFPNIDEIFSLSDYSLNLPRNIDWVKVSREVLSNIVYNKIAKIDDTCVALREAFEKSELKQYREAIKIIENEKNKTEDDLEKGFLMQIMAEYMNFLNGPEAQQILLSAMKYNRGITRPISGIQHQKLLYNQGNQAKTLFEYIKENDLDQNNYVLKINSLLESLDFSQDSAKRFEAALMDLSFMLGIVSSRPEFERGKGPDNLWVLGDKSYLVIECKNETRTETIKKHDCNQLNGSIEWFENEYRGNGFSCFPVMIHNANVFEYACSPNTDIRIMTPEYLEKFRNSISSFAENLVSKEIYGDVFEIQKLLEQYKLVGKNLVEEYTVNYRIR
jgi:hypothetical protein